MARRSGSAQRAAERYFPVRVRIFVPERGLGRQLDILRAWLEARNGRRGYWIGADAGPGFPDAALIYFLDVVPSAQAFVDHFGCGTLVITPGPQNSAPP